MKLREFGLINALKARWLKTKYPNAKVERFYSPLTLDQVSLIIGVYAAGLIMAVLVVIIENIITWRQIHGKKSFVVEKYYE